MAAPDTPSAPADPPAAKADPVAAERVYRHRLPVRIWHMVNAVTLLIMLMSGLMIFNAHPRLYWGQAGANADYAWLAIGSTAETGFLRIGDTRIDTTGMLGRWTDGNGVQQRWAFPGWATIPTSYNLADGRRWHLTFAWLFGITLALYLLWAVFAGHLAKRLRVRRAEWAPGHLWHDIKDHARLRFPSGAAAAHYSTLQKLAYIGVIFILLPLMVLTGLTMGPGYNTTAPWLVDLFGGRQSARSIHFIAAWALVLFFLVHIAMVLLSGPVNGLRSMLTGWFRLPPGRPDGRDGA